MTGIGNNRTNRRGLTLIELLVVGTIIMIVTAASLPVVKPLLESQLTRSGAQVVYTALSRAKARAMLTGRPCGVQFESWPGTESGGQISPDGLESYFAPGASMVIKQVDVPPVFSGMFGAGVVSVDQSGTCHFDDSDQVYLSARLRDTEAKIQFGGSGPYYKLTGDRSGNLIAVGTEYYPITIREGIPVPFKILFKAKVSMAAPVTLPRGTVVDLQFSGVGRTCFGFNDVTEWDSYSNPIPKEVSHITVLFAPDGSVQSVEGPTAEIPTGTIHFLVGRWEQIAAVRDPSDTRSYPNYADGRNYWVSVNPQTGTATTNQVNPVKDLGYPVLPDGSSNPNFIAPYPRDRSYDWLDPSLGGVLEASRALTL